MSETNKNNDLWKLSQDVRLLKEQMEEWQERSIQQFTEQMAVLDGIQSWCGSILYQTEQRRDGLHESMDEISPDGK